MDQYHIFNVINKYTALFFVDEMDGGKFHGFCPVCQPEEKEPSLVIFVRSQSWRCFGKCGQGGDAVEFVMHVKGITREEALVWLKWEVDVPALKRQITVADVLAQYSEAEQAGFGQRKRAWEDAGMMVGDGDVYGDVFRVVMQLEQVGFGKAVERVQEMVKQEKTVAIYE